MTDEAPSGLTSSQYAAFAVPVLCSTVLSILGSGALLFKILRNWAKNGCTTPYDRFVLGLSVGDILYSSVFVIIPFSPPSGQTPWAIGNAATCHATGFLAQLSGMSFWYNGLLSCFFLLTVLSQVQKKNYVGQFETWLHLTAAYWPITAILGFFLGWYGQEDFGIFAPCTLRDESIEVWTLVAGIPTGLAILSMFINYGAIYAIVRKSLRSSDVAGSRPIKKETTTLMILYVASVVVTTGPLILVGIFFPDSYYLGLLAATTLPLQGVCNFFIYIKPVYARFRAAYPNESKWFVLKQAILKSKAPPLQHRRVANNITDRSDVLITDVTLLANREMNPSEAHFYPGQLFSTEIDTPQLDDPSNPPETNDNTANEEGQG